MTESHRLDEGRDFCWKLDLPLPKVDESTLWFARPLTENSSQNVFLKLHKGRQTLFDPPLESIEKCLADGRKTLFGKVRQSLARCTCVCSQRARSGGNVAIAIDERVNDLTITLASLAVIMVTIVVAAHD